ncbi:TPA: type II toxin-antitoxin system PemK/MazF family toxin [Candidatus Woesearchaeota archaeon]|nr:type II toxin-antitoxin system PemK/MazF family toxin [Candidatus Woesearchaeota archaeon]
MLVKTVRVIKADKIFTLKRSLIKKKVARVNKDLFDQVMAEILKLTATKPN